MKSTWVFGCIFGFCTLACEPESAERASLGQARVALECESSAGCVPIGNETWVSIDALGDWKSLDIGTAQGSGTGVAQYQNGAFTVEVTGTTDGVGVDFDDVGMHPDQMRFVYTPMIDDTELVVRVSSLEGMRDAAVGVAVRAGTGSEDDSGVGLIDIFENGDSDPDSHDFQIATRPNPTLVRNRMHTDAFPQPPPPSSGDFWTMPQDVDLWFRLRRIGDGYTVARSLDGTTWVPLVPTSGGVFTPDEGVIGFFVSAGLPSETNRRATAVFENVSVGPLESPPLRTTWVGGTFVSDTTGFATKGMTSFYVNPEGRAFKYAPIVDGFNHVSVFDDGEVTMIDRRDLPTGGYQGAIAGEGNRVFIAGSNTFCDTTALGGPACELANTADCTTQLIGWYGARECAKCGTPEVPRVLSCDPADPCRRCTVFDIRTKDLEPWWFDVPLEDGGPAEPLLPNRPDSDDFDPPLGRIGGMAAAHCPEPEDCPLYVADIDNDLIRVIHPWFFYEVHSFTFEEPGPLASDKHGNVWVIRGAAPYDLSDAGFRPVTGNFHKTRDAFIRCFTKTGASCGEIGPYDATSNPEGVVNPTAIAIDPRADKDRLVVAENGSGQNVRIYDLEESPPELLTTFGEEGGVFSGASGSIHDASHGGYARFYSPTGVGLDEDGNLYVASGLDVDIRKFTATSDVTWNEDQPKNIFGFGQIDGYVDFDPVLDDGKISLFSAREHFKLDPEQTGPGSEWEFSGITWNPFLHPERDDKDRTRRRSGVPVVRRLPAGERMMYVLRTPEPDPDGEYEPGGPRSWLSIYRFDGDVAIPAGTISVEILCGFIDGPGDTPDDGDRCDAHPPGGPEPCACNIESEPGIVNHYPVMKLWVDDGDGVRQTSEVASTIDPLDCSNPTPETEPPNSECGVIGENPQYRCPAAENSLCGGTNHTPAEAENPAPPGLLTTFEVDAEGNIWLPFGTKVWKLSIGGVVNGVPIYDLGSGRQIYDAPEPLDPDYDHRGVQELRFDGNGVPYLHSGLTQAGPTPTLRPAKVITRLPGWPESENGDCEEPGACWERRLPDPTLPVAGNANYSSAFYSGTDDPTNQDDLSQDLDWAGWMSFDVAGDKIFVAEGWGPIHVFETSDGSEVDRIFPGPELSGSLYWEDTMMGIRAFHHAAGNEYYVAEAMPTPRAATVIYRWKPPETTASCSSDLECQGSEFCGGGTCAERACDPNAYFEMPTAAFTGTTNADGLTFSYDGLTGYVSSKASSNYDIYVATRSSLGDPFGALSLLSTVSTSANERAPFLSQDGLNLYMTKVGGSADVAVASRASTEDSFGSVQLISALNSSVHDQDPFFLWAQQALYFASERPSGANRDLYISLLSSGSFATPVKLDVVNSTSAEDYRPVLSNDGLTLYFASTRSGIGYDTGGDVWIATRSTLEDDFGTPVNLGAVNTNYMDYPVALSSDGCTLYFASDRHASGQPVRLYQAQRGVEALEEVTVSLNLVGSGSVTTSPFNCVNNGGTCSAVGTPGSTLHIYANDDALWTGACTGHDGNPGSDGVLVFMDQGVCTVTFQ